MGGLVLGIVGFEERFRCFRKKNAHNRVVTNLDNFCYRIFNRVGGKRWKKPDKLNTGWNGFGKFVGIVWELFGNCLELSNTDYQ